METEEKTLLEATVVFPIKDDKIFLAIKAEKIGAGCRNGYGGGVKPEDKTIKAAATREFKEESTAIISTRDLVKVAVLDFYNVKTSGETFICRVHFFFIYKWKGELKDTKEMYDPQPFSFDELPENIMPADEIFLPLLLAGKKLTGTFYYGPFQKELTRPFKIKIVKSLT